MGDIFSFFLQNNMGLMPQNFTNHNAVMDKDGAMVVLWTDTSRIHESMRIVEGSNVTSKYRDSVVSELNRYSTSATYDQLGPCLYLSNMPKWDNDFDYAAIVGKDTPTGYCFIYKGTRNGENIDWEELFTFFSAANMRDEMFTACSTNQVIICYATKDDETLYMGRLSPATGSRYPVVAETTLYYTTLFSSFCDHDGEGGVMCAIAASSETVPIEVAFVPFSHIDSTFGSPVDVGLNAIIDAGDFIENLDVAYDNKNSAIGYIASIFDDSEDELIMYFGTSVDGGTNWSSDLITQGGSGTFLSSVSSLYESHVQIMAGAEGGFIIGYTAESSSGYARPYVHQCEINGAGTLYTMGSARKCGQALKKYSASTDMIGPVFFRPPAEREVNIDPIGLVYIAYQIDQGNDFSTTHQETSKTVAMAFERLDDVAFPATAALPYTIDTAGSGEFIVPINILGTASEKQDYYTNGFTGDETNKYIEAFHSVGTAVGIKQYVPRDDIYIGGRAAYESPVEYSVKVMFDPKSWTAPNPQLGTTEFEEYIARDLRKVYLPPNFYMEIVENISLSETKQYTVWTIEHDSYTYEIRQIIPRFVNGQIVYYEANCYNVGNYSVWSRGGGY